MPAYGTESCCSEALGSQTSGALAETQRPPSIPIPTFTIPGSLLLTSSAPTHEAKVVEPGHLVLHDCGSIPQLGRVILIIARHHCHHRSIRYIPQGHHLRKPAGKRTA